MRIGIEAQRIFRKKKHGMDMVALELIRNLQQLDTTNEYFIFVQPDEDDEVIQETTNFKIIQLPKSSYVFWEQILLPQAAKKYACDILHCTSNTAPLFSNIPLIVTLHDIIYMERSVLQILNGKGTAYQKFGNLYRKFIVPQVVKKANKIITVSNFEEKRIATFFNIQPAQKLLSIYNGVSSYFTPTQDIVTWRLVKEKYNLPENYFFFMGNTDPKKNTVRTIEAFSIFTKQSQSNIKLLLLDYDKKEVEKILLAIGHPQLIESIVLVGYVNNTDLPAIYSHCRAFLYPSLRESFGIPIVEAMACGAPVITSNTSSMPEIAGGAACLIDPTSTQSITEALLLLHHNATQKEEQIKAGFIQASKFTWQTMAQQNLQVYHQMQLISS